MSAPSNKGGVRAWYYDIQAGEKKPVTDGEPPYQDMHYTWSTEAEAKAAAKATRQQASRGKASFSCTIGGNADLRAETLLVLAPPFRNYIPSEWRITSVKHSLDANGGFVTTLDCELSMQQADDNV